MKPGESASDRASTRVARQARILELITRHEVASQAELATLLANEDLGVSQGTLSKDLLEIGAVRVRGADGVLIYAPPGGEGMGDRTIRQQRLARLCAEISVSAEASANLVVLKTPPGAAQYFASNIDLATRTDVLGTVAGDDTILVITRDPHGGDELVAEFTEMAATSRPQTERKKRG